MKLPERGDARNTSRGRRPGPSTATPKFYRATLPNGAPASWRFGLDGHRFVCVDLGAIGTKPTGDRDLLRCRIFDRQPDGHGFTVTGSLALWTRHLPNLVVALNAAQAAIEAGAPGALPTTGAAA